MRVMRTSWLLVLIIVGFTKNTNQFNVSNSATCDLTKEFDCGTGNLGCIPKAWQCDNVKDCHNGADEVDCEPNECQEGEFLCHSGSCVDGRFKCDGLGDCFDGTRASDENYCEYNSRRLNVPEPYNFGDPELYDNENGIDKNGCRPGFGFCSLQKMCIPNRLFCDGKPDFYPHPEDERNCTGDRLAMLYTFNPCKDKFVCKTNETYKDEVCIQMEEVCDGKKECPLGDDELEKCSECSTKHCEYQCKNTPTGAKCVCEKGHRLASDGFSCVDIDECTLPERACDHFCENQIGSYRCSCAKGYHLKADNKSCESTTSSKGTLLLSVHTGIEGRPLDFSDTNFTSVYNTNLTIVAFDYLRRDDKLFMITHDYDDGEFRLIVKADGKPIQILRENNSHPFNLAVDWIGSNLFFTEFVSNGTSMIARISVCTLVGKFCRGLIEEIGMVPSAGFTIHPMRGLIFYTDHELYSTRIIMANMDGSQKQVLLETNLTMIKPLVIDYLKHDLYFVDQVQNIIQRVNIDTKTITVIDYKSLIYHPNTMAYHNGFLYWTEMYSSLRVMEVAREGSRAHVVIPHHPYQDYMGMFPQLIVNDSLHQPEPSHNPCKELDCPWICVIVPDFTAKCLCPDGYTPSVLGTTCIPPSTETGEHNNLLHIGLELMSEYCKTGVGCLNGGSCREVSNKTRIVCDCVQPYDGLYCERRKPILSDEAVLTMIPVILVVLLLTAIGYGVYWFFFVYRKNEKYRVFDTESIASKSTVGGAVYYENDAVSLG